MMRVANLPEGFMLSVRAKDDEGTSFVAPTTAWALTALGFGDLPIYNHPQMGSTVVKVSLADWDKIMGAPL